MEKYCRGCYKLLGYLELHDVSAWCEQCEKERRFEPLEISL